VRDLSELLTEVRQSVGLTLAELGQRSGTSAPTLSNYERGRKEPRFATVARILESSGHRLRLEAVPIGLDRPLTRKDRRSMAMHRLVAAKLLADPEAVRMKAGRNLSTLREANADGHATAYLEEWARLLDGPADALIDTLTSERQSARDLRQVSPFAGTLSEEERRRIIRSVR
jgi:transcriptional regulator with XRE-family HTH domain